MPRLLCAVCKIKSRTVGCEHINFHEIPYKDPPRLLCWETKLQMKFKLKEDKHVCDLHFLDDQFDADYITFLQSQKWFTKKRKLKKDACPTQREPQCQTPYLRNAEAELKKIDAQNTCTLMKQEAKKTYSKIKTVASVSRQAAGEEECHTIDLQSHEMNNPCAASTPIKRSTSTSTSNNEQVPIAPKRLLLEFSPVKSVREVVEVSLIDDAAALDYVDTTYNPSADTSQFDHDMSAETSMEKMQKIARAPEEKAFGFKLALCETNQIDKLLQRCQTCGAAIKMSSKTKFSSGAMITYEHQCENEHVTKWRTCDYQNKTPLINVELTAAALCSGISYAELERFSQATEMACISRTTFDKHKSNFCYPVIKNDYWDMRQKVIAKIKEMSDLVFAGDGRFDSPGKNSAKFCHYSILEVTTNLIVDFVIFQKNIEPGEMESKAFKLVFQRVVDEFTEEKIKVFCSDRSLTVGKKMKDCFKAINHAFDIWHLAKGVNKSLRNLSKKFQGINYWRKAIVNHIWYASQNCGENADELIRIWESMLNHVQNIHEWVDKNGKSQKCFHEPLTEEKISWTDWIENEIEIHALKKALFNTRILNQLRQCRFFVHTSSLESFHNLCLVYAPKRIAYTYEGMVVRTILAILDHNSNVGRNVVGDKIEYSKISKQYKLRDQYEEKDQTWRRDLVRKCVSFVKDPALITFNPDIDELLMPFDLPANIVPSDVVKPTIDELRKKKILVTRM